MSRRQLFFIVTILVVCFVLSATKQASADLMWLRHKGYGNGSKIWSNAGAPKTVRRGMANISKDMFPGRDGVLYRHGTDGHLYWYRHTGNVNGTNRWHPRSGTRVGTNWSYLKVFADYEGHVYGVVKKTGELHWWRHNGALTGAVSWTGPKVVGSGWHRYSALFPGSNGVIYALKKSGELAWFRHDGRRHGTKRWAYGGSERVVTFGAAFHGASRVFGGRAGVIYSVHGSALHWWRHDGYRRGVKRWATTHSKVIGNGFGAQDGSPIVLADWRRNVYLVRARNTLPPPTRAALPKVSYAGAITGSKSTAKQWRKAIKLYAQLAPKPHTRAFKDLGKWWLCPAVLPRRTGNHVASAAACATTHIIGERVGKAKDLGAVKRDKPIGAELLKSFFWRCPVGYARSSGSLINSARACFASVVSCVAGSFANLPWKRCFRCPKGYRRALANGADLTKVARACTRSTGGPRSRSSMKNPEFVRWAERQVAKLNAINGKVIEQAGKLIKSINTPANLRSIRRAKSDAERGRLSKQLVAPLLTWAKQQSRKPRGASRNPTPAFGGFGFPARRRLHPANKSSSKPAKTRVAVDHSKDWPETYDQVPTISIGWTVDASLIVGATVSPQFWAFDTTASRNGTDKAQMYAGHSFSVGITAGMDMGVEIGFWTDVNHKLSGNSHGFVVGVSGKVGLAVAYWWELAFKRATKKNYVGRGGTCRGNDFPDIGACWSCPPGYGRSVYPVSGAKACQSQKYLGMTLAPQYGASVEAEYTRGMTTNYSSAGIN